MVCAATQADGFGMLLAPMPFGGRGETSAPLALAPQKRPRTTCCYYCCCLRRPQAKSKEVHSLSRWLGEVSTPAIPDRRGGQEPTRRRCSDHVPGWVTRGLPSTFARAKAGRAGAAGAEERVCKEGEEPVLGVLEVDRTLPPAHPLPPAVAMTPGFTETWM